jgi:hypothetical protein
LSGNVSQTDGWGLWRHCFEIALTELPLVLTHQLIRAALVLRELSDELRAVRCRQIAALAANTGCQLQLVFDVLFSIHQLDKGKLNNDDTDHKRNIPERSETWLLIYC